MYAVGLECAGYRPLTATGAAAALHLISSEPPDAVVTDLRLAGVDGWDLVRSLKQKASTRRIPVVVLTGYTDSAVTVTARKAGCAAVITKPCLPDELVQVLQRIWSTDTAAA